MDEALFRPVMESYMTLHHHIDAGEAAFRWHMNRREGIDDRRPESHQSGYCRKVHQEPVKKGYIVNLLREYANRYLHSPQCFQAYILPGFRRYLLQEQVLRWSRIIRDACPSP